MLAEISRHWRYFIPRLLGYGGALGALFGALTYPIFGAFVGAPWGLAGGLALGILMGVAVPIYNRYFAPDDADTYQTHLTFGTGMLSIAVMAIPLLFIYSLVAGMVAAYVAHQYADSPLLEGEKRKYTIDRFQKRDKVFTYAAQAMMSKARYVIALMIGLAILAYSVATYLEPFSNFVWGEVIGISIGGLIYGLIAASSVAAIDALFIVMVNRLFFHPDTPKSQYKPRIIASVSVLTLFLSMIVTFGVGAPFAAIAGAFGAAKYADWYYELDQEEKAKHSADNLLDADFDDDEFFGDSDDEQISRK